MKNKSCSSARIHRLLLVGLALLPASLLAEPVTLHHAVDLALKHATGVSIAAADEQHASASYRELRNSYIPQLNAGAGIGWSDGFPLSLEGAAPSLFNVNAQSALINPALKDFIRAAQSDVTVSTLRTKDQRNQVIQDAVLTFAELAKWEQRLSRLRETLSAAAQTETAGAADVLREHLSKLTGLPTVSIEIDPDSVPALPEVKQDPVTESDFLAKAADANPVVRAAVEHARAQYLRVAGEHRSLWPSVDFAAQYANLATYNNYDAYYKHFQPNNATVGVSIHLPFLNYAQHERVKEAESEARKATTEAEAARNQVSEETLRLQRSVTQMQAAHDVAELEYEIAQKNIEATRTRMESSTANLHDLDNARTQASESLITLQNVTFELERSQVALMRATGDLETWALGTKLGTK